MKRWPILTVALEHEGDVVLARQRARRIAALVDFDLHDQTRIATAVSEIARNAQAYGVRGRVEFSLEGAGSAAELLTVKVTDKGVGLADPQAILEGRFLSDTGLGVGISGARRLMDVFDLQSRPGHGVVVVMSKRLQAQSAFEAAKRLGDLVRQLASDVAEDPIAELRNQNQELLRSLEALETRRIEAVQLSEELERTNKGVVALYAELDEKARELEILNATLERRIASALNDQAQVEERLRQSQKMEAIGQLTGGVAHDFNNLLMIIGGSLELLRRRVPAVPAVTRLLDAASQGVARGGSLNQQLLAFARKQDLREEVFCVNAIADSFLQLVERAVSEDITIRQALADDLWHCCTDPHQLETAVLNLSINARDAMVCGGVLTFATANRTLHADEAASWDAQPGDYVEVSVADTGTGMTQEVMGRVFEPFFTTKAVGRGTGLGLSQVYGFAKQSGGFVSVQSEIGQWTKVSIHLKRVEPSDAAITELDKMGVVFRGTASILMIEDDLAVQDMTSEMLRDLGYHVTAVGSGEAALCKLEIETFDLVFSDVILRGGVSGVEIAHAVASRWSDTPVLLTSGYTAQQLKLGDLNKAKVLIKPYDTARLSEAVRQALEGR